MRRIAQRGSILVSVIVALVILAAVSHMLILQQSERIELLKMDNNRQAAEYLAEAGLRAALLRVRNTPSPPGTYPAAVNGSLPDQGTYNARITPNTGTPISVTSTGTTKTGVVAEVTRTYAVACAGKIMRTAVVAAYENRGSPTTIFQAVGGPGVDYLPIDKGISNPISTHALMTFSLTSLPKGIPYESAELVLDVQQHDSAMEGGTLFVNRITKAYEVSRVNWTDATSTKDKWITPGGDYTLVNEARTIIAASATTYSWTITPIVHGWVNGTLPNNGLLIRTDSQSSQNNHKLRLKKNISQWTTNQWPRLVVKYCE